MAPSPGATGTGSGNEINPEERSFTREPISAKKQVASTAFLEVPKKVKFNGNNTSEYLQTIDLIGDAHGHSDAQRCLDCVLFLPKREQDIIKKKAAFIRRDWEEVKELMLDEFMDEEWNRYSPKDLERCADRAYSKRIDSVKDFVKYHRRFRTISEALKEREIISWQDESATFLQGLPKTILRKWEDGRRRRRLDLGHFAISASKTNDGNATRGGVDPSGGRTDDESDAPLVRRQLRKSSAKLHSLASLKEIAQEVMEILEDDEMYGYRGYRSLHRSHEQRHHSKDGTAETDTETRASEEGSSEDESNSESESDDDRKHKSSKEKKSKHGKKEEKKIDESPKEEKEEKVVEQASVSDGLSHLANHFENSLKIFATTMESMNTRINASAPAAQFRSYGGNAAYASNTGPATYPNNVAVDQGGGGFGRVGGGPITCFTCGGAHGFKDVDLCKSMQRFLEQGIVTRSPTGTFFYRGKLLPLRSEINSTFEDWINAQESAQDPKEEKVARFKDVLVTEYYRAPQATRAIPTTAMATIRDWGTESDLEDDAAQEGQIYEIDAGKRTRANPGSSSSNAEPPTVKRVDTRSIDTRRAEHQQPAPPALLRETPPHQPPLIISPTPAVRIVPPPSVAATSAHDNDEVMTEATVRRKPTSMLKNSLELRHAPTDVFDKLLNQGINMPLGMFLASSPDMAKAMLRHCQRRKVPLPDQEARVIYDGNLARIPDFSLPDGTILEAYNIIPSGATEAVEAHPLGHLPVVVHGREQLALIDSGSMISVISDRLRKELGLIATKREGDFIRGIGGHLVPMAGICVDVEVQVGGAGIKNQLMVSTTSSVDLLLGAPFLHAVQAHLDYTSSGGTMLTMKIGSKTLEATLRKTGNIQKKIKTDQYDWNTGDWQGNSSERVPPSRA